MLDDLKVTRYDDDLEVVLDAAFASNGEDGQGVLPGGLTGQILKKLSNADYDTLWDNPSAGVPNDGTAGQILSKASSDPYDTIWINPPDPVTGLYLPLTGGTLTGELSVPSIVVPGDTASILMGGSEGTIGFYYDSGYLSLTNSTWGGSLQLYSPGTVPGAVNSQICTLAADPDGFALWAFAMGSATQPHFLIQSWDFGTASVSHLTTYVDNAYDIGIATPISHHGRPRNIYVATSINTPDIFMPRETSAITMGPPAAENGNLILANTDGWLSISNTVWGGGLDIYAAEDYGAQLSLYGAGSSFASANGTVFSIDSGLDGGIYYYNIATYKWGTAPPAQLYINQWNFNDYNTSHITTYVDNAFDIGIATPIARFGRPRNIYVGTAFYEAGVTLANKYAGLAAAGNIFTGGPITLNRSAVASSADIFFNVATLQTSYVNFQQAGVMRWRIGKGSTAEGGSGVTSTGSSFNLQAYDNAGTLVGTALTVARGSMVVNFAVTPTVAGVPISGGGGGGDVYLANANVFTAANTFNAAVPVSLTHATASLAMGPVGATYGQLLFSYEDGWVSITNEISGTGISFYGENSSVISASGQYASISLSNGWFEIGADSWGGADPVEFSFQKWGFGTFTASHLTPYPDNAFDIGTASPTAYKGRPRSLFLGTSIVVGSPTGGSKGAGTINATAYWENGVTLASKYEALGVVAGINTQTASYTLVLADAGKVVEVNNASANTLTIPPNSTVAFPLNTRIDVAQYGAGQTTITAGAGVTIRQREAKLKLTGQYAGASLYKRGTDEWVLFGDVSA